MQYCHGSQPQTRLSRRRAVGCVTGVAVYLATLEGEKAMLFTLEALNAQKGDCLILHYGDAKKPNFIVIDGGPDGVYANALKPRLAQILKKFKKSAADPLDIGMVMVSHIDDDH